MALDYTDFDALEVDIANIGKFANDPAGVVAPRYGTGYSNIRKVIEDTAFQIVGADTWANLAAMTTKPAGTLAEVLGDVGTHNDPITGTAGISNTGRFSYVVGSPSGWKRIGDPGPYGPFLATFVAGPIAPAATGTTFNNAAYYFWPSSVKSYDQWISKFEMGISAAGSLNVIVAKVETDGTLSFVSSTTFSATVGAFVASGLQIALPANHVAGVQLSSAVAYYNPAANPGGELGWAITAGTLGSHTAKIDSGANSPKFRHTMVGEIVFKSRAAYDNVLALTAQFGITQNLLWPNVVATGSDTPGGYVILGKVPATVDGYVKQVNLGATTAGAVNLVIFTISGSTVTVISKTPITMVNGITNAQVNVPISAGQYSGIELVSGSFKFQNLSNPLGIDYWYKVGGITTGDVVVSTTQHRFEIGIVIKTGLLASGGSTGIVNTGLDTLSGADSGGVTDVTGIFSAGRSAHPFPYVRPGSYAVTALRANGGGLWGPGKVLLNGERFFTPAKPEYGNLYNRFRASMLEHIGANDMLGLVADSIGHFAYAPTGPKHHFNRLTRFANAGIAKDEPIMTALRPSSTYTPDFYGVTVTGSASTGTRGPLGESLILAAGASISFVGAYEEVDVFYTQQAGAGSLAFSFNGGAAYKTVNAAGATVLDSYTGPSATGQAASGTYTITATGAAVELTGLIRLGVKIAGTPKRLLTGRFAHGSYTFGSFIGAPTASIIKQATFKGGKLVPVIALGTNDMFGTDPAGIVTVATTMIDAFVAAGCDRIFGIPPTRPTTSWDVSFTGGRTYDPAVAALRRLYRQRGVYIIPTDMLDWIGEGLYQDGLHAGEEGMDRYAQIEIESMARSYSNG
jgi:hypothetical protein